MIRLSVPEYGRIYRDQVSDRVLQRLQRFDELHAKESGSAIFDWNHVHYVRALNRVGVIQVPGISIEILPKIDKSRDEKADQFGPAKADQNLAQRNLLFMLATTRDLPIQQRDIAKQQAQSLTILEFLIRLFAKRLLGELRRGIDHAYIRREENLRFIKGKILLSQQVKRNSARSDLTYVGYDDFIDDTLLNQIIKSTCRRLLSLARSQKTKQLIYEAMLELGDVADHEIELYQFDQVHLDRSSERYRVILDFCRFVYLQSTPAPSVGGEPSFCMLFPMDVLFEEFIGRFLKRHAGDFGLVSENVHIQAKSRRNWLLRNEDGQGKFRLKPDVLVSNDSETQLIIDTKWKRLLSDKEDSKNGVSQADIYQLYAYATRYDCERNILLFPLVDGATPKHYLLGGDEKGRNIRIEFIDLSRDLAANIDSFKHDLAKAVLGSKPSPKEKSLSAGY